MAISRRSFARTTAALTAGLTVAPSILARNPFKKGIFFDISLAEWSLHRRLFDGEIENLDFPGIAKDKFGIEAVEYVNQFFMDKAENSSYLSELKQRANDAGVRNVLIMCDKEGELGNTDDAERKKAVENHYKWVNAAKFLGCHSIRVNAAGKGTREEVASAAVDGLGRLAAYAAGENLNVIVENHGGYSSDGTWLTNVIKQVDQPNCGTLPDFGNFRISEGIEYDRYKGVKQMMPFAKGVSAKSYDFNENGEETHIDFHRMLRIVKDAGYTGYIGIEYEGEGLSEEEGIIATKELLEKIGKELS